MSETLIFAAASLVVMLGASISSRNLAPSIVMALALVVQYPTATNIPALFMGYAVALLIANGRDI